MGLVTNASNWDRHTKKGGLFGEPPRGYVVCTSDFYSMKEREEHKVSLILNMDHAKYEKSPV